MPDYLVIAVHSELVLWHVQRNGRYELLSAGADGLLRSELFPGLWLDPAALLRHDMTRVLEVLNSGMASDGYRAFATSLM